MAPLIYFSLCQPSLMKSTICSFHRLAATLLSNQWHDRGGMQELDRAGQAKAAMFPQAHPSGSSRDPQDPSHHLYVTSHGAYGAGEQRHRHYDWERTGLNPASHSFGEALHAYISLSLLGMMLLQTQSTHSLCFYLGHLLQAFCCNLTAPWSPPPWFPGQALFCTYCSLSYQRNIAIWAFCGVHVPSLGLF